MKIPAAALDHRRFWDAMDVVSPEQLTEIERRIGQAMAGSFGLDLSALVLDMTNFATFIDTGNDRAPIAQRGKARQKRHDLRLVGLALVVTRDGGVPVVSRAYPGNKPDVTQFTAVVDELAARYAVLARDGDGLTVVFDAGNDSAANQDHLAGPGLHFVASLPPSWHPDLLAIPTSRYRLVDEDRFGGLTAVEATAAALGADRRVILTHSPTFHARQALEAEYFGKRILFTDRDDWPAAEIIAAYRSQADAEAGFRQLKDPRVVSFSPMFHWTEQKIREHAFYCILALTIAHLMRRQAAQAGLDLSVRELLHTLAGIQETVMIYPSGGGRPKARRMLTDRDPTQQRLFKIFNLSAHAPRA